MRMTEILDRRAVEAQLRASNKAGVLRELVGLALKVNPQLDPNQLVDALLRREKLQSTGIGGGLAVPNGKCDQLPGVIAAFGRSAEGLDYQSLDDQPTRFFFTLLVPSTLPGAHLRALARITRLFRSADLQKELLAAEDAQQIYDTLIQADAQL